MWAAMLKPGCLGLHPEHQPHHHLHRFLTSRCLSFPTQGTGPTAAPASHCRLVNKQQGLRNHLLHIFKAHASAILGGKDPFKDLKKTLHTQTVKEKEAHV